ncbi:MAG: hypothetical protein RM049_25850 [Nostoc sp. DedQUE04]|uniref:hypothetical protein n=1 Tax=Nostoc sp. DedQUE04 TaxID=3075390 RepID=UPI002AD38EA8|nr:hypothetical protein [Nostoc sp. DedQUE04]MDZ8138687.1 hypothetical protein [Nostoc sp. DedQUE04]
MQVYLNALPVLGKPNTNEIVLLDNLNKEQILEKLRDVITYPNRNALAFAKSIYRESDKEAAKDLLTLNEYLERENIVVSKGDFHLLAIRVAKAFIEEYGIKPRRVNRRGPAGDYKNKAYAYTDEQLRVIDRVLTTIPHVKNPRR